MIKHGQSGVSQPSTLIAWPEFADYELAGVLVYEADDAHLDSEQLALADPG